MPKYVLYVEDNPVNAELMQALLEASEGVDLEVAVDGASALKAVRLRVPDLLLIDGQLPDTTGIELLSGIRAAGCRAPAVFVSAADESACVHAERAGFDECWMKPVSPAHVLARIHALVAEAG
jgi:two-component system, OmpR family, KDP operon response regulator KdpE